MTPLMHCEHCSYFDCACGPTAEEMQQQRQDHYRAAAKMTFGKINIASGEDVVLEEEVS